MNKPLRPQSHDKCDVGCEPCGVCCQRFKGHEGRHRWNGHFWEGTNCLRPQSAEQIIVCEPDFSSKWEPTRNYCLRIKGITIFKGLEANCQWIKKQIETAFAEAYAHDAAPQMTKEELTQPHNFADDATRSALELADTLEQQKSKRIDVLLDDNCIETIKRLTPSGGEEINFGGVMGGIRLLWRAAAPAAPLPINITERYKLIIETFRNYMTEEDFKKAMQELANNKGENHVSK